MEFITLFLPSAAFLNFINQEEIRRDTKGQIR